MAKYKVHIVNPRGESREEVMEASDKNFLYRQVSATGDTLVTADEITAIKKSFLSMDIQIIGRVNMRDKYIFARNLGAMIEAGLSLSRALSVIEKQTRKKKFKNIIASVNASVSQGKTLSESMEVYPDVFPPIMSSMVRSGEESGSLAQSLRVVALQMENMYQLGRKIRGALMYPGIILTAIVGIGIFMLIYVVPTLSQTFKQFDAELPMSTQFVIGLSDFLKNNYILAIILALAVGVAVWAGLKTKRGKKYTDYGVLHVPIIGEMVKEVNSARTARTLASLLSAGVDVVVASKITEDVLQNGYYKKVIEQVGAKIQKGEPIAEVFSQNEHLYPPFVAEMVAVGEETGQLAQMLQGVAVYYENEVDQKTKDMTSIIEPFLMVIIGIAVGFFAISMISPIYSLSSTIN